MHIAELVKKYGKYGLDRRTIDYYSTKDKDGKRLIPCEDDQKTGYRIYGEEAEKVIRKMIILRSLGFTSQKIKTCIADPTYFSTARWNEHIENLENKLSEIKEMIQYAKDLRDSHSIALKLSSAFSDEDPQFELVMSRITSHVIARIFTYLDSPSELQKKSFELADEVSNFTSQCASFLQLMQDAKEELLTPDSDEVQEYISRFIDKLDSFFGIAVYLLYSYVREMDPVSLGLGKEATEEYIEIMDAIGICAKWFKTAKTRKQAQKYDLFKVECQEDIRKLDEKAGESTVDFLIDLIQTIVNIPSEMKEAEIDRFFIRGYNFGVDDAAGEVEGITSEDIEEVKDFGKYILDSLKWHISNSKNH